MNYTELFREKRLEYYQDTGISCNAVLMSDYFAKELMKENDIHFTIEISGIQIGGKSKLINLGGKFLGVEIIKVYSPTLNYGIQFFRKVE